LLLRGLDPNVENKFLETPIFIAAEMGSINVLALLLDFNGTRVDKQDKFGDNIMHVAARDGQHEVISYLINKYGKRLFRVKNQQGKTPLQLAIENAQTLAVQALREYDAPAAVGDRNKLLQDLAKKLIHEPPDYR